MYTLSIEGDGSADDVREAFEEAVRSLRGAEGRTVDVGGSLVNDGVTTSADDVTDEPAGADVDEDEDPGE